MKIRQTWTKRSLRNGQSDIIDEEKARTIIKQTMLGRHATGECSKTACSHCDEPAMKKLLTGAKLEQFFCTLELVEA